MSAFARASYGQPVREYSVQGIPADDLQRTRRELAVSLALSRPGSPVRVPIAAQMSAIDDELAERTGTRVCSCGYGADNPVRFGAHLENNPGHQERAHRANMPCHWPQCKITINGQDTCDEGRGCK